MPTRYDRRHTDIETWWLRKRVGQSQSIIEGCGLIMEESTATNIIFIIAEESTPGNEIVMVQEECIEV